MSSGLLRVSICLAAASTLAVAQVARADEELDRARDLVYQGDDLAAAGRLDEALAAYRQADAIVLAPTTSIEVASVLVRLRRFVEARAIASQLAQPPASVVEPEPFSVARRRARDMILDIDARAPSLTVSLPPWASSTWLRVDHAPPVAVGALPVQMDPGPHLLVFEGDAIEPSSLRIELVERDRKHIDLQPTPRAKADVSALTIVAFASSGVGLVTAAIAGGAYLSMRGNLSEACATNVGDCSSGARADADAVGWVANVGMGVFLVGGIVGGISLGFDLAGGSTQPTLQAIASPDGLLVRGVF
jgi:hypothetical protein